MKLIFEFLITVLLFLGVCVLSKNQQRVSFNEGKGWDGVFYYKIAEQIQQDSNSVKGELPFIKRIGTHFLVGAFSKSTGINLLDSAFWVNIVGAFFSTILLLFWMRLYISIFWIRLLLSLLYILNWMAPLRYTFFCSMTTDAWGSVWFIGGLVLLHYIRLTYNNNKSLSIYVLLFSVVTAIGSLYRESNSILALALFFLPNPVKKINISVTKLNLSYGIGIIKNFWKLYFVRQTLMLLLPVLFIILVNVYIYSFVEINYQFSYSYYKTIISHFYSKSFPKYLLGILIAFGPLILLLPFYYSYLKDLLSKRQEMFVLLILSFTMGFVGGTDTERIVFMSSYPIVFILLGQVIKEIFYSSQRWWFYVLLILQSVALRVYWTLPDHPANTDNIPLPIISLWGNNFNHLFLYSYHGHFLLNTILLLEYFLLLFATFFVLRRQITFPDFSLILRKRR